MQSLKVCSCFAKRFARIVPVLENRLQPFGGHRLHAHQRALDIGFPHGVKILGVFARFHGDLGKEHHVLGQLCQLFHQLKSFDTNGRQLLQLIEFFCSRARRKSFSVTG